MMRASVLTASLSLLPMIAHVQAGTDQAKPDARRLGLARGRGVAPGIYRRLAGSTGKALPRAVPGRHQLLQPWAPASEPWWEAQASACRTRCPASGGSLSRSRCA
jgi:hypothetical protein